jgi:hypothetical protein
MTEKKEVDRGGIAIGLGITSGKQVKAMITEYVICQECRKRVKQEDARFVSKSVDVDKKTRKLFIFWFCSSECSRKFQLSGKMKKALDAL